MAIMGVKLSFGGGKQIGSTKAPGGGANKPIRKTKKKWLFTKTSSNFSPIVPLAASYSRNSL